MKSSTVRSHSTKEALLPVMAATPRLSPKTAAIQVMQSILIENWSQFESNLTRIRQASDSEVLHQARVGWRRFNSTLKFFKPLLPDLSPVPPTSLRPLRDLMGQVRDVDVALKVTLPTWGDLYARGHPARQVQWRAMIRELQLRREQCHLAIDSASRQPEIQAGLQDVSIWIETLECRVHSKVGRLSKREWRMWIERRFKRLNRRLEHRCRRDQPKSQHKARILAKQLRYEVEILHSLLPKRWVHQALKKARTLQTDIGLQRDRWTAHQLVDSLGHYTELADFIQSHLDAS